MQISRRAFALAIPASAMLLAKDNGGQSLKQVTPTYVCFINKKYLKKSQQLVMVGDKSYYACCDDCARQLRNEPKSRLAKDPVSGNEFDMSTAAVGVDKDGNAYFFESQKNLKQFRL